MLKSCARALDKKSFSLLRSMFDNYILTCNTSTGTQIGDVSAEVDSKINFLVATIKALESQIGSLSNRVSSLEAVDTFNDPNALVRLTTFAAFVPTGSKQYSTSATDTSPGGFSLRHEFSVIFDAAQAATTWGEDVLIEGVRVTGLVVIPKSNTTLQLGNNVRGLLSYDYTLTNNGDTATAVLRYFSYTNTFARGIGTYFTFQSSVTNDPTEVAGDLRANRLSRALTLSTGIPHVIDDIPTQSMTLDLGSIQAAYNALLAINAQEGTNSSIMDTLLITNTDNNADDPEDDASGPLRGLGSYATQLLGRIAINVAADTVASVVESIIPK